jgi:spermidine synthase
MTTENWLDETLYDGWRQRFRVQHEVARLKTDFQDIVIVETLSHGRVLFLDGVVQITEADEFAYQEMITHVPLVAHGEASRVLVIGAGDGGVLRRVLEHRNVTKATMVEIDGDVIRLCREHMPGIAGDAWNDPRAEIIVGDGIAYVENAPSNSFDVIIVDSTDPIGVGTVLFTDEFYAQAARVVGERGLIVNQCGVPSMQADELRETSERRLRHFDHVSAYVAAVPTYVGGFMTLGIAWNTGLALRTGVDEAGAYARAQMTGRSEYWTPDVHQACFALPPYIARHLPVPRS